MRYDLKNCLIPSFLILATLLVGPFPIQSQERTPTPPEIRPSGIDTYSDPAVEALIGRARIAKSVLSEGLSAYEARMWENVRVGVMGSDFRRERVAFEQERRARIRWSAPGDHMLLWESARREMPITGMSSGNNGELAENLRRDLVMGGNALPAPLLYDPGSDQIAFGRARFLSPLADTAEAHYRYYSDGRTVRLGFGGEGEGIVLTEVRVEPRRADPRLISASLWFDESTGALVRSSYRPARPFDLLVDRPDGEAENPPGFLTGTFLVAVNYVTVDHGLYDLRWWIPRRFAFEGVVQLGGVAQLPVEVEWTLEDVWVNDEGDLLAYLTSLSEDLPTDWSIARAPGGPNGEGDSVTVFLPPQEELISAASPVRGARSGGSSGDVFSQDEIAELERVLGEVERGSGLVGTISTWEARDGAVYFNRVEGLSLGVTVSHPIASRTEIGGDIRYGFSDEEVGGTVEVRHHLSLDRTLAVSLFSRVDPSSEWSGKKGIVSSLETLLFGSETTPFHRARGIALSMVDDSSPVRTELRVFAERQASVQRNTNTHLARLWSEDLLSPNPPATEGHWTGASVDTRWESGGDPRRIQAFGRVRAEVAGGSSEYFRGWTSAGVTIPLGDRWGSAIEGGIGGSAGDIPLQRRYTPGGAKAFRGIGSGESFGEAFWFGRFEVGRGLPAARVILFVDALELAPSSSAASFKLTDPDFAVGIGVSVLDGLFRLDVARQFPSEGERGWKVFLYRDGLF